MTYSTSYCRHYKLKDPRNERTNECMYICMYTVQHYLFIMNAGSYDLKPKNVGLTQIAHFWK